jgi:hypothetical protein
MSSLIKKKRGRKPKNIKIENNNIIENDINSEDENIILHLPIKNEDINKINNSNNIFINNNDCKTETEDVYLSSTDKTTDMRTSINNNIKKIITHSLNYSKNTKCWWCRNNFETPSVQLPQDYYNETYYCIGNFCSYNCAKSYNVDLNDNNIWKRESLLNNLYYDTYHEYKDIKNAPSWMTLLEYGGTLSISEFRESFTINNKDYLILQPPLTSRQIQIEESYKINKNRFINNNKPYTESENNISMDFIMGLSKK